MKTATKDDVYRKVGIALERAQNFESNVVVYVTALKAIRDERYKGPAFADWLLKEMEESKETLGPLVKKGRGELEKLGVDWVNVEATFNEAIAARNHLAHSFYRKHGAKFNDASGRGEMITHIEELYVKIEQARRVAEKIAILMSAQVLKLQRV
ncbi:hypothetical protein [Xanthomonas sacchari]|uniref:hypothetical protein n=1 Tax=Xanthomonas sacchari TaxID=56458 RepID=UPI00224D413D|nr:hypothetical protein [Xanthomonas sacchari]